MTTIFGPEHAELLGHFRKRSGPEARREALREVVQIHDRAFLDRLIAMDIGPEKALVLRLVPLVFVAWADGELSEARSAPLRGFHEWDHRSNYSFYAGRAIVNLPDLAALETFWSRPLTGEQLQAEVNRMARNTRNADLLRELFASPEPR
mgnify:CR=1 FL=1